MVDISTLIFDRFYSKENKTTLERILALVITKSVLNLDLKTAIVKVVWLVDALSGLPLVVGPDSGFNPFYRG